MLSKSGSCHTMPCKHKSSSENLSKEVYIMETTQPHSAEKKKTLKNRLKQAGMIIFAIMVGLFFISGYISTQNLGAPPQASTSSQSSPPTVYYGVANANATIIGYNNTLNISIQCSNSSKDIAVNTQLSKILTKLETNNSVYNFYSASVNQTLVLSGTMNTMAIFNYLGSGINQSYRSCVSYTAPTDILLPLSLNFRISNKTYPIRLLQSQAHSQIISTVSANGSKTVPVRVSALITVNGTVYSLSTSKIK